MFNATRDFSGGRKIQVQDEKVMILMLKFALFVLPGSGCVDTAIWMHHMDANEAAREETRRKLHKNVESSIKQVLETTPHETPTIRTLAPHHENYTS